MRWTGHVARVGEMRNVYKILVGKPERKRSKRRWEDNISIYLREIGWEGVDWMHLIQDMDHWQGVVSIVTNLRVP
jgi:hypothetical protein